MSFKNLRPRLVSLAILAALLFGHVQTAAAVKPDREPLELGTFILEGACEFEVLLETLMIKETLTSFYDRDGNLRIMLTTGPLKVRITNMETGKSLDLNISGIARDVVHEDGSLSVTGNGPWLIFLTPEDIPGFQPRLFYITGYFSFELDSEGFFTEFTVLGGRQVDMCAELSK